MKLFELASVVRVDEVLINVRGKGGYGVALTDTNYQKLKNYDVKHAVAIPMESVENRVVFGKERPVKVHKAIIRAQLEQTFTEYQIERLGV